MLGLEGKPGEAEGEGGREWGGWSFVGKRSMLVMEILSSFIIAEVLGLKI